MSGRRTVRQASKPKQQQNRQRTVRTNNTYNNNNNNNNNNTGGSGHGRAFKLRNNRVSHTDSGRIIVSGVPSTVEREDLMQFLKAKSYKPNLNFTNFEFKFGKAYLTVEKPEDIPALVTISGTRYGSSKLFITKDLRRDSGPDHRLNKERILHQRLVQTSQIKQLEDHLVKNPNEMFVDLSYVQDATKIDFNQEATLKLLFKIIKDKRPKANTISFVGNDISSLEGFRSMIRFSLDNIINFDFSNNKITKFEELDYLSDLSLRELVFRNNPIALQKNYRMEVATKFPDLQILDGVPISSEDFPKLPIPVLRGNFAESKDRLSFAYKFLEKYLTFFDKSRADVVPAYTENSRFSMTFLADKNSNARGTSKTYLRSNRNLKKSYDLSKKTSLLYTGAETINNFWKLFPTTSHYLQSSCIDTFLPVGTNTLFVVIHGHYLETIFNTKRSFDRTFALVPSTPGSEAALKGWEATILCEQLHIRPYNRFPRLEASTLDLANPVPSAPAASPQEQEALIAQFSTASNLKPEFARDCLMNNSWDPTKAMELLMKLKANNQIPQEYYKTA